MHSYFDSSLEDFLEEDEILCIKEMSFGQYANLGDFMFAPKKIMSSKKVN